MNNADQYYSQGCDVVNGKGLMLSIQASLFDDNDKKLTQSELQTHLATLGKEDIADKLIKFLQLATKED
ncbi:MAG: hypothetical protein ACPGEF_06735 [Endozoicomonas sp.]